METTEEQTAAEKLRELRERIFGKCLTDEQISDIASEKMEMDYPAWNHSMSCGTCRDRLDEAYKANPLDNPPLTHLGSFEATSGKFRVSDPCYSIDTWCAGNITKVKTGTWEAFVKQHVDELFGGRGLRTSELLVFHNSVENMGELAFDDASWKKTKIHVDVDSGQAGIFEYDLYPEGGADDESFYERCGTWLPQKPWDKCKPGVVVTEGANAHSGYGDGSYDCYTLTKYGKVVGVRIVFISEGDDE